MGKPVVSGSDAEDDCELTEHHHRECHCPGNINRSLHSYHIGSEGRQTDYKRLYDDSCREMPCEYTLIRVNRFTPHYVLVCVIDAQGKRCLTAAEFDAGLRHRVYRDTDIQREDLLPLINTEVRALVASERGVGSVISKSSPKIKSALSVL